jgi:hypothetical protein
MALLYDFVYGEGSIIILSSSVILVENSEPTFRNVRSFQYSAFFNYQYICRLDFEDFVMDGGSAPKRPCDRDSMRVTGSTGTSPGVTDLCGFNTGQHLYLPITGGMAGASIR